MAELPFPEPVKWRPGTLLTGRSIDKNAGLWTGLVRYRRDGLLYEHWLRGDLLMQADGGD